jgi:hypothetical protein
MALRGALSSRALAESLHSLTADLRDQAARRRTGKSRFAYAEGKRRFGTVGKAVVEVLSEAGEEMTPRAVHQAVERKLGGEVSFYSVYDRLRVKSKGPEPLFEHSRHGYYRLLP